LLKLYSSCFILVLLVEEGGIEPPEVKQGLRRMLKHFYHSIPYPPKYSAIYWDRRRKIFFSYIS